MAGRPLKYPPEYRDAAVRCVLDLGMNNYEASQALAEGFEGLPPLADVPHDWVGTQVHTARRRRGLATQDRTPKEGVDELIRKLIGVAAAELAKWENPRRQKAVPGGEMYNVAKTLEILQKLAQRVPEDEKAAKPETLADRLKASLPPTEANGAG